MLLPSGAHVFWSLGPPSPTAQPWAPSKHFPQAMPPWWDEAAAPSRAGTEEACLSSPALHPPRLEWGAAAGRKTRETEGGGDLQRSLQKGWRSRLERQGGG